MTKEDLEKRTKKFFSDSICVQPRSFESLPTDLRQGIIDYYKGKGIPVKVLEKYYGFGKSLSVKPDPKLLKTFLTGYC